MLLSEATEVPQRPKPPMLTSMSSILSIWYLIRNTNGNLANRELLDYIANLVDERIAEPKDDLISKLVVEQV